MCDIPREVAILFFCYSKLTFIILKVINNVIFFTILMATELVTFISKEIIILALNTQKCWHMKDALLVGRFLGKCFEV